MSYVEKDVVKVVEIQVDGSIVEYQQYPLVEDDCALSAFVFDADKRSVERVYQNEGIKRVYVNDDVFEIKPYENYIWLDDTLAIIEMNNIYDNEYLIQEEKTSIVLLVGNTLQLYSLPIEQGDYLVLENNELIYYTKTKDKITFYKLK